MRKLMLRQEKKDAAAMRKSMLGMNAGMG